MSDKHSEHSGHFIIPLKYYVFTLCSLLVLTVITVAVAQIDLGGFNIVIALLVAVVKASLVVMFFMGLRFDDAFNRIVLFGSLAFFVLFVAFLLLDVTTRDDIYSNEGKAFDIKSPVHVVEEYSDHHGSTDHEDETGH